MWYNQALSAVTPAIANMIVELSFDNGADEMVWKLSTNGNFTTKSAWEHVRKRREKLPIFEKLWSNIVLPSISIFNWRLLQGWISVDIRLKRKNISLASKCLCCRHEESLEHLFLQSPKVRQVWSFFGQLLHIPLPDSNNVASMFGHWFFSLQDQSKTHIRTLLPLLITWFTWDQRNKSKFEGHRFLASKIVYNIIAYARKLSRSGLIKSSFWKGNVEAAHAFGIQTSIAWHHTSILVKWTPPESNWIKINTDGASRGNPGRVGAGGIARQSDGKLIFGFYRYLGHYTNNFAELWAIYEGLEIAMTKGYQRIWIESDSMIIVNLLNNNGTTSWDKLHLLGKIHLMLRRLVVKISHVYREANSAADFLANLACDRQQSLIFEKPVCPRAGAEWHH